MKSGIRIKGHGSEEREIEIFLENMIDDLEEIEKSFLKRSVAVVKTKIIQNLNILRTTYQGGKQDYTHMADDVKTSIRKNGYGERIGKIFGGPETGSKWHIVNDGTYRNRATHFIDSAITGTENERNQILDEEMRRFNG